MLIPIRRLKTEGIVERPYLNCVLVAESLERSPIEQRVFTGPENSGKGLITFRKIAIISSFNARRGALGSSLRIFPALLLDIQT
jgi:hypothetical protein